MMLHDKIVPGQFLLDMKNDCTNNLLHGSQPGSKLDIYNTYNYHHYQRERFTPDSQVLDLSRRCDSVETRKTPSPYNSSFGTASPSTHCGSPPTSVAQPATNLAQNKVVFSQSRPPPLAQGIASLYPLYYPHIKQETASPPPAVSSITSNSSPLFPQHPAVNIQKTRIPSIPQQSSPRPEINTSLPSLPADTGILFPSILNAATTGAVSASKSTRPFNAFPRDPLMVAAHFAASDVLFDKTTMERYSTYRKRALDDLRDSNGGHRIVTNPKMRRTNHRSNGPNSECDEKAMESSDNDSSNGNGSSAEYGSHKNDGNNNDSINSNGDVKDEAYYERRRKNNAAAKKSRDRRRIKEDEIAIRAAYLERQNIELLCQIDALKKQLEAFTKV
ncbi:protein giant [Episyrphus balteatus]|uniref:protein giant n=1 Tax=Episyrphus balteatus TaxID=286459 RepID=UPI002484E081|nr:protein giant [Episyrphus balteatus]